MDEPRLLCLVEKEGFEPSVFVIFHIKHKSTNISGIFQLMCDLLHFLRYWFVSSNLIIIYLFVSQHIQTLHEQVLFELILSLNALLEVPETSTLFVFPRYISDGV